MDTETFYQLLNENYKTQNSISPRLVNLSQKILKLYESCPVKYEKLKKIPHSETMNLISDFLKETFGETTQSIYWNNLYGRNDLTIVNGLKRDIEKERNEIKILQNQKNNNQISKKRYFQEIRRHYEMINFLRSQEQKYNQSFVNNQTLSMFLDLRETIEDAFYILHETTHQIYIQPNEPFSYLNETAPLAIEFLFNDYCIENKIYLEEVTKFMRNRMLPLKEDAIRILIENIVYKVKRENVLITEEKVKSKIEEITNPYIKGELQKEFQENFNYENGYHETLYKIFETYIKSYYVGILIAIREKSPILIDYTGKKYLNGEKKLLKHLKISLKNQKEYQKISRKVQQIYGTSIENPCFQR